MRKTTPALLLAWLAASLPLSGAAQKPPLSPAHKAWLEDEVATIITPVERDVFRKLESDAERETLIEEFWRHRDPTPGTPRNELKDEHYRRLAFADKTFSRGGPFRGRQTERGRIYIALGPPVDVQRITSGDVVGMEIWTFLGKPAFGQAPLFRILFYQKGGGGDYVIYNPIANSPKDLVLNPRQMSSKKSNAKEGFEDLARFGHKNPKDEKLPEDWDEWDAGAWAVLKDQLLIDVMDAALSNIPGNRAAGRIPSSILLAEVQNYPQKKVQDDYAKAILEHKPVVEVSYSVKFIGNQTAVAVLEGPGGVPFLHLAVVPQTISLEQFEGRYLGDLRATLRLADESGRTVFQQERSFSVDLKPEELKRLQASSFQIYDAVPVVPGKWILSLLLENLATKEFTSAEKKIEVPEAGGGPASSPLILARQAFRDAPAGGAMRAFQVGPVQVYPSINNVFPERSRFFAFLQLRGLTEGLKAAGRMRFVLSGDDKPLWRAERALREYDWPGLVLEEIAADSLAAATYALRASLLDEAGREILAAETPVRLTGDKVPSLWVTSRPLPAAGDPAIDLALGRQYLAAGRTAAGVEALAKAAAADPRDVRCAVAYAQALLTAGDAAKALGVLLPFAGTKEADFDLFEALGRAAQGAGRFREAVDWLKRALALRGNVVSVLNRLGECHLELGEKEAAEAAGKKSLQIMPGQDGVRALLEKLRVGSVG